MSAVIRFAHLSDWHATTLAGGGGARFRGKRLSGWASWAMNRRRHHDPRILDAAIADVRARPVDRILVTGDLTHISLEPEFRAAAEQLARLGSPEQVFLIPGNHDCYVPLDGAVSWDHWAAYLAGESPSQAGSALGRYLAGARDVSVAPRHADYPVLRRSGRLAMIGLCSAIPTPVFRAGGALGEGQLERLEGLLATLGGEGFFRVVMIHHPIALKGEPTRRALWDAEALRGVLARSGAELVIHGHKHRRRLSRLPGPSGDVPVVGVPSSSEVGSKLGKLAQYHVYTARERDDHGFVLEAEIRRYDSQTGSFAPVEEQLFDQA